MQDALPVAKGRDPHRGQALTSALAARRTIIWRAVLFGMALSGCVDGWAQDAFRASLAGQAAAEAKQRSLENRRYNVKLGPVALRLAAQFGVEATDNVRNTGNQGAESDLIFRPQLNFMAMWRVSQKNSLDLSLGVGYVKYLRTSQYDSLFVSPDTDLSFDLFVSDFKINFHSRFAYSQDVTADPTISGVGRLSRFENTSGVEALWDLNKAILTAGYDHAVYLPTESQFSQYDRSSDLGTLTAALRVRPTFFAGVQVGGGMTTYDSQTQPDSTHIFAGPVLQAQLNEYSSVRLSGGYVSYSFEPLSSTNAAWALDGFFFDLTLRQRLGKLVSHSLSVGHQIQSGLYSSTTEEYYARYGANWRIFRKTGLGTSLSYQNISYPNHSQSGARNEAIDYYGLGLTLSRPLARHTTGSLGYQLYLKDSDIQSNDYVQNRLVLNVVHAF